MYITRSGKEFRAMLSGVNQETRGQMSEGAESRGMARILRMLIEDLQWRDEQQH